MTWGYWVDYPLLQKSYPCQLERLLGPGYQVRNYGYNGASAGKYPGEDARAYLNSGEHVGILRWKPDVIISGLGINDCLPAFSNPDKFEQGYRDLVTAWRASGTNPSIWMWSHLTPDFRGPRGVTAFPGNVFQSPYIFTEDDNGISGKRPSIEARMQAFAPSLNIGEINAYDDLATHPEWSGEGLHFAEAGQKRLAELVYCRAWESRAKSQTPLISEIAPIPGADSPKDETGTKYPWVELHNPNSFAICLDDLALDSGEGTARFVFGNSTVLWPNERKIVFLSGKNLSNPGKNLHASFTVQGGEGQVRLIGRSGNVLQSPGWRNWGATGSFGRADATTMVAVDADSPHSRLVTDSPASGWQLPGFNDTSWISGKGGAGFELAPRAEAQFGRRWNCNAYPSGIWGLAVTGTGAWTAQGDGTYLGSGTGLVSAIPSWSASNDFSWTYEVRMRLNGQHTGPNAGFVIKTGTRNVGGNYATFYIQSDQVRFGYPYAQGSTISTESNMDDYHVFRIAYHAPTRRTFIWRDGVEITGCPGGRGGDSSRQNWLTFGGWDSSLNLNINLDYMSLDTSGAFAPVDVVAPSSPPPAQQRPLAQDCTGTFANNSTCLMRIPFTGLAEEPGGMKLKIQFDDGFRAWINGTEVASCNAPQSGLVAPSPRDDDRDIEDMVIDLSSFKNLITSGENLLAVQVFNAAGSDGRCFVSPSLELSSVRNESPRYFSPTTARNTNGTGSALPAMAWLDTETPPPTGGSPLLVLDADSDGDGRSNLLEYSQGTSVTNVDGAPVLNPSGGQVQFLWRDNNEVGWRLMESSDLNTWYPAVTTGPPTITASGVPGMKLVTQGVAGTDKFFELAAVEEPYFTTWQDTHFTAAETGFGGPASPTADPDGDQLPNFVEFAINSDPKSGRVDFIRPLGRFVVFPDPGQGRGVAWTLQSSSDLITWRDVTQPRVQCMVDPGSGRYLLKATDETLPVDHGYLRIVFSESGN